MEAFVKIREKKPVADDAAPPPRLRSIHEACETALREHVAAKRKCFVTGAPGVGKSYILRRVMPDAIEIQTEHMRSKSNFLALLKNTDKDVFVEDYDEAPLLKRLVDDVSNGMEITRGAFVATSKQYALYAGFENVHINKPSAADLLTLVGDPTSALAVDSAHRARGSVLDFFNFYDNAGEEKDDFRAPKTIIKDILTGENTAFKVEHASEHGNMASIMHENYPQSKGSDIERISLSFSDGDVLDQGMYHGHWDVMYAYANSTLVIPRAYLGEPIKESKIRAGSVWTKHGNMRVRAQRLAKIRERTGLGIDALNALCVQARFKNVSKIVEYGLTAQDFDVMNHICVGNRLKASETSRVKKLINSTNDRADQTGVER